MVLGMKTFELYNPVTGVVYQLVAAGSPIEALEAGRLADELLSTNGEPHLIGDSAAPHLDIYARELAA